MITQIAYTNSNCSDLWEMFLTQNALYTDMPLCVIADDELISYDLHMTYLYDNIDPYWEVWSNAIKKFDVDYFIYLQEDFVLYDRVDDRTIIKYVDVLHKKKDYSFIRLLKVDSFNNKMLDYTLYEVEPNNKNVFAMQPTIWRAKDYLKLLDATREPKWLETPKYRRKMAKMGMKGMYHYDGEPKKGKYHYDSYVYPYIATALVKGKWAMSEYGEWLRPLLEIYNIDPSIRGSI